VQESVRDAPKQCPWCGEAYEGHPATCPHCEEDLAAEGAAEVAAEIARLTREDEASGAFRHPPRHVFRRVRNATIAWTAATLVLIGTGLAASGVGAFFGWMFGVITLIVAAVYWIGDLLLLSPEKLTSADRAFKTYLKCLRESRWEYARHLVVPRAREGHRARPAMEEIKVLRADYDLSTADGLKGWWRGLLGPGNGVNRTAKLEKVRVAAQGPDLAVASCEIAITAYPSWILVTILLNIIILIIVYLATRKSRRLPVQMRLARVGGRWYMIEPVPALSRAPGAA